MFDTMFTEPVPARVFEMYRVVNARKTVKRSELEELLVPDALYPNKNKPNYINPTLNTAIELGILSNVDNNITALVDSKVLKSLDDLRNIANQNLYKFRNGQFYQTTNAVMNMNEEVFHYNQIVELGKFVNNKTGIQINDTQIRGWRFWAEFLGFGNTQQTGTFLPNAYVFLHSILPYCNIEKKTTVTVTEFLNRINTYAGILTENNKKTYLNLAFSSGLRQLHENKEIILKHENDREINQQLYPSESFFRETVTDIEYLGVRK